MKRSPGWREPDSAAPTHPTISRLWVGEKLPVRGRIFSCQRGHWDTTFEDGPKHQAFGFTSIGTRCFRAPGPDGRQPGLDGFDVIVGSQGLVAFDSVCALTAVQAARDDQAFKWRDLGLERLGFR